MAFGVDYSQADASTIVPEGTYEVIVRNPGETYTRGGTYHISIPLVIRNDIEQPRKNTHIWHQLWQKKEQTETSKACSGFVPQQIQMLSKAAGLPNGKQYESLDDWCNDLDGKLLSITVKHEEYNGYMNARVGYINPTRQPDCHHVFKTSERNPSGGSLPPSPAEENDDDLPF